MYVVASADPLRLTYERRKREWSQTTLANRAETDQRTISLIETGQVLPTPELLDRLAQVLHIFPGELLLKKVTVVLPEVDDPQPEVTADVPTDGVA